MSKDSVIDYLGCIVFRLCAPIIRFLPLSFSLFLGRRLGDLMYYFALKHKAVAYANIKMAFAAKLSPSQISKITKEFYEAFGQNIVEIFFIPRVNKKYIDKYINIEGLEHISEGFRRGKGVILLAVHEGSWELSNIICANLKLSFSLFIRDQRHPRLNKLLNSYRSQKGCKIIQRKSQMRQLIEAIKSNQAVGMTLDQGGRFGAAVKFFGKDASMATAAIRLALKYDAAIIPGFYTRVKGPYIKIFIEPPFKIKKSGDRQKDLYENLQRLTSLFEKYILEYPKEYLWSYKIWKYGRERSILILSDGKTGHFRQAQAVANIVTNHLKNKNIKSEVNTVKVEFKSKVARAALTFSSCLAGKYHCQGCLWCLRAFLQKDTYKSLIGTKPDIVISCGSAIAPINFVLSRENRAQSIVIMRPSILSTRRFDLVIIPRHDNPPKRKNVAVTEGALNLIDEEYLKEQSEKLIATCDLRLATDDFYIGLLIGGDTKNFYLRKDTILEVISQIKSASQNLNVDILVSTSRRTSGEAEKIVKEEFKDYPRCKILIIANEKNIPYAIGGILGLSRLVVVSPESISMISEAATSQRYVLVFKSNGGLDNKHKKFLNHFLKNKYIDLSAPKDIGKTIEDIWRNPPRINTLEDRFLIRKAMEKLI